MRFEVALAHGWRLAPKAWPAGDWSGLSEAQHTRRRGAGVGTHELPFHAISPLFRVCHENSEMSKYIIVGFDKLYSGTVENQRLYRWNICGIRKSNYIACVQVIITWCTRVRSCGMDINFPSCPPLPPLPPLHPPPPTTASSPEPHAPSAPA